MVSTETNHQTEFANILWKLLNRSKRSSTTQQKYVTHTLDNNIDYLLKTDNNKFISFDRCEKQNTHIECSIIHQSYQAKCFQSIFSQSLEDIKSECNF